MSGGTGQTGAAGTEPVADLFGYPDRAGRGQKGRPAFQVTHRDRNRVRLLLALGWGNPRIATALEISLPTLHRYFKVELQDRSEMRDRLQARQAELLWGQVERGNVGAMKMFQALVQDNDRMAWDRKAKGQDDVTDDAPAKKKALGKKEQGVETARDAVARDPDLNPGLFAGKLN